jgi:6-phosphogluconolactonase
MEAARMDLHVFASPDELAEALAKRVARELAGALAMRGKASLAVSGGKTPVRLFQALSAQPLDWRNVGMTLVDERLVPDTDQRSNARLVQENLLRGEAAEARFMPLYSSTESPERAARNAESALAISAFPFPLDVVVLGMGTDGHTASFFPDAGNLESLLDPSAEMIVAPVHAESGGEPRHVASPDINTEGKLWLREARHPILEHLFKAPVADGANVAPGRGPHRVGDGGRRGAVLRVAGPEPKAR